MFKKNKGSKEDNSSNEIELVVLASPNTEYELSVIKSLLEDNNIPYIIKDKGAGGYMRIYTGSSMFGTEILVEKSQLEQSLHILEEFPWDDGDEV